MSFSWARPYEPKHPLMRWFDERLPLPRVMYGAVGGGYPVPRNLNYFWNFGVLAGIFLTIQIATTYKVLTAAPTAGAFRTDLATNALSQLGSSVDTKGATFQKQTVTLKEKGD